MAIHGAKGIIEDNVDQNKTIKFKLSTDIALFMNVVANIYSNKELATVRELFSNALDAHSEYKQLHGKEPDHKIIMDVVKDEFDTTNLVIRDFGIGMSEERITKIYTTIGASSKTGTNHEMGKMGIGSKSPFCLSKSFILISYYDGNKSTWNVFMNETNLGIAKIKDEPTTAPNGVEYNIPLTVDQTDIVMREILYILQYNHTKVDNHFTVNLYSVLDSFIINDDKQYKAHEISIRPIIQSTNHSSPHDIYIIQGNIPYAIPSLTNNIQILQTPFTKVLNSIHDVYHHIRYSSVFSSEQGNNIMYDLNHINIPNVKSLLDVIKIIKIINNNLVMGILYKLNINTFDPQTSREIINIPQVHMDQILDELLTFNSKTFYKDDVSIVDQIPTFLGYCEKQYDEKTEIITNNDVMQSLEFRNSTSPFLFHLKDKAIKDANEEIGLLTYLMSNRVNQFQAKDVSMIFHRVNTEHDFHWTNKDNMNFNATCTFSAKDRLAYQPLLMNMLECQRHLLFLFPIIKAHIVKTTKLINTNLKYYGNNRQKMDQLTSHIMNSEDNAKIHMVLYNWDLKSLNLPIDIQHEQFKFTNQDIEDGKSKNVEFKNMIALSTVSEIGIYVNDFNIYDRFSKMTKNQINALINKHNIIISNSVSASHISNSLYRMNSSSSAARLSSVISKVFRNQNTLYNSRDTMKGMIKEFHIQNPKYDTPVVHMSFSKAISILQGINESAKQAPEHKCVNDVLRNIQLLQNTALYKYTLGQNTKYVPLLEIIMFAVSEDPINENIVVLNHADDWNNYIINYVNSLINYFLYDGVIKQYLLTDVVTFGLYTVLEPYTHIKDSLPLICKIKLSEVALAYTKPIDNFSKKQKVELQELLTKSGILDKMHITKLHSADAYEEKLRVGYSFGYNDGQINLFNFASDEINKTDEKVKMIETTINITQSFNSKLDVINFIDEYIATLRFDNIAKLYENQLQMKTLLISIIQTIESLRIEYDETIYRNTIIKMNSISHVLGTCPDDTNYRIFKQKKELIRIFEILFSAISMVKHVENNEI